MGQRKTIQHRVTGELAGRSRRPPEAPLYGISPQYPGKLIQRLSDGTELVGTFKNGTFVPEIQRG